MQPGCVVEPLLGTGLSKFREVTIQFRQVAAQHIWQDIAGAMRSMRRTARQVFHLLALSASVISVPVAFMVTFTYLGPRLETTEGVGFATVAVSLFYALILALTCWFVIGGLGSTVDSIIRWVERRAARRATTREPLA